jgi:heptosyltransferase-2
MTDYLYLRLPNWVGDACMCLPAIKRLQAAGLPLVLCGRPWAEDLFAGLAPAGFVPIGNGWRADMAAIRSRYPVGRGARGVVFTNSLSSAAAFRLAGIRTAGYRGDGRSVLLKWPFTKREGRHEVEIFHDLARLALWRWGVDGSVPEEPDAALGLPLTGAQRAAADAALAAANITEPFVLLSPTATGLHHGKPKAWPEFGALAASLQREGWTCVTCPPAHEVEQARAAVPTATMLPAMPLGAFASLTTKAALVVCNDSGTSHVAAAAGARQITLFGVTRRERTGPWSKKAVCLGSDTAWPTLDEVERSARFALVGSSIAALP